MVFPQKQTKLSNCPTDKWWKPICESLGNLYHPLETHFFVGKMKSLDELTAWASFQHKKVMTLKRTEMTSAGKNVRKREHPTLLMGM